MKNKDINKDDYLGKLIQTIELDSPSDNFVNNVMSKCYVEEIVIQEVIKSRFKLILPWVTLAVVFIILFGLTFVFGGGIIGGSIYGLFSGSTGTIGSILLKALATMSLTYVGIGLGIMGGFMIGINELKQKLTMRVV
jgi:hypothetical protein